MICGMTDLHIPQLGRLLPPYGGISHCANEDCQCALTEELGAFMFKVVSTDKLCVLCGSCAIAVELLPAPKEFVLVAL